jgi:hypothetical protein
MRLCILFAVAFFYSCGNTLLDFMAEGNSPGGGSGNNPSVPRTTEEDVPEGVTPIYIDSQKQFDVLVTMGLPGVTYPLDGYYILRGNEVSNRTFVAGGTIMLGSFTGTLTGWYKDEAQKTIIKLQGPTGFFTQLGIGANDTAVSWLRFETEKGVSSPYSGLNYIGIVAAEADNTLFSHVTVAGTINVPMTNPAADIYAGGFVGVAGPATDFDNCNAEASVSVTLSANTASKDVYVGGIAGEMAGSVENGTIGVTQVSNNNTYLTQIRVTSGITSGAGTVYAGGVAGSLSGTVEKTVVLANVNAAGDTGVAYGGGFAGISNGTIKGNIKKTNKDFNLAVTAALGGSTVGNAYAGGLAGLSYSTLEKNNLTGTISITAKHFNGESYAGGFAGKLVGGEIKTSSIAGAAAATTIQSYSENASSTGKAYAGGLAGLSDSAISDSSFSGGTVRAGFVPAVSSSSSSPPATGVESYAGGIVGWTDGTITKAYVYAEPYDQAASDTSTATAAGVDARTNNATAGKAAAGGIAGRSTDISESYAVATVKARAKNADTSAASGASAGGISGISEGAITDTFALARIDARPLEALFPATSKAQAGGIAGYMGTSASVATSYAAGQVAAFSGDPDTASAGGIAGYLAATSPSPNTITGCAALQLYVASNGVTANHHRMIGYSSTTPSMDKLYAYELMKKSNLEGTWVIATPSATDENGAQITSALAKTISYYNSNLGWDANKWKAGTAFPVLSNLTAPTVPLWAQLP